jgi:branched-chain amino acid transport system permease protein/neutral amino acid transport system permease protein
MDAFVSSLGFGIVTAAILMPAAVGFTLQFSATNVLNIAFGAQMTLSAFIAWDLAVHGLNPWLALVCAAVSGALSAYLLNRLILAPFAKRGTSFFGMIVVTIALALLIEYAILAVWGPNSRKFPLSSGRVWHLGALVFTTEQLVILGVSIAFAIFTHTLLRYTKIGKSIRAVASNPSLARASGVPAQRVINVAWLISGAMAGAAGIMLALNEASLSYTMGDTILIEIIAAAILGGVGQPYGAMFGALIIGVVLQESANWASGAYAPISAFVVLIVVLLIRPSGLFSGAAKAKGVAA